MKASQAKFNDHMPNEGGPEIGLLEALAAISLSIATMHDLPAVLETIVEQAVRLLNGSGGGFYICDPERREVHCAVSFRTPRNYTGTVLRYGEGLAGQVAETRLPIIIDDYRTWEGRAAVYEGEQPFRAVISTPVIWQGQVRGVLHVLDFNESRRFIGRELDLLTLFGNQAAMVIENARLLDSERLRRQEAESLAIENARLFEQAATERRHLSLLFDINKELVRSLNPDEILEKAISLTCQALGGKVGEAFLYLPEDNRLSLRAIYGREVDSLPVLDAQLNLKSGEGLAGWVAEQRQPACVADVTQDAHWFHVPGVDDDIRSAIAYPILTDDQLLGTLSVLHQQPAAFSEEHVALMQAIGQEVGLALSNARRYQQVQRRLAEITLIQNLAHTFSQRLEVQTLLDEVVAQLAEKLGYPYILIFFVEGDTLVLKASHGYQPYEKIYPLGRGIIGRVARTGQAAFVPDVSTDPDYYACFLQNIAELTVPISRGERVVGVITVQSERSDQLTSQDRDLLQVLAGQISVALENALLYEQVRKHAQDLEGIVAQRTAELTELFRLSQGIGYLLSYDDLLHLALHHLQMAIHSDLVMGWLGIGNDHTVVIQASRAISPTLHAQLHSLWARAIQDSANLAPETGGISFQIRQSEEYDASQPEILHLDSVIRAPIIMGTTAVGTLMAGSERQDAFGAEGERLLSTFANQASTAAARLEALLTAQQRLLESLVEHLPFGVLLLNESFHILVTNPAGRELVTALNGQATSNENTLNHLGPYSIEELTGKPDSLLLPVEVTLEEYPKRIFSVLVRQIGGLAGDEKPRWVLTIGEITQERQNIERIQTQERLATVGQLAAGIAHDFNNILASILVYTDLLLYEPSISPANQDRLSIIQQQVERASSLIRQILDFSRRSVMEQTIMDLLPLVKELDKMLVRILPETIHLELAYQPGAYWTRGDPTRLQQVFVNLALNARDAMPEGGKLRFELEHYRLLASQAAPIAEMPEGNWIRVTATDSGGGIPAEILEHIFEPFFTTKPVGQGTGLGLAQVYGIIKQHEGHIDVKSRPGRGTVFTMYLPALEAPGEQANQSLSQVQIDGEGHTILVVEDDPFTRMALQTLLEADGFQVLAASNGIEALEFIDRSQESILLVISDVVMPQMGGVELYQILREQYPEIRTLLITGHPLDDKNRALLEDGHISWLQKPFSVPAFNQALKDICDRLAT